MLPSKCYFIPNTCPFFVEGGCDRPHCHYRHSQAENDPPDAKAVPSEPLPLPPTFETPEEISAICPENASTDATKLPLEQSPPPIPEPDNKAEAPPPKLTPATDSQVPSYRPTPISVLKQRHLPVLAPPDKPVTMLRRTKPVVSRPKKDNRYVPYQPSQSLSDPKSEPDSTVSINNVESPLSQPDQKIHPKTVEYTPTGEVSSTAQYTPSQIAELAKTEYTPSGEVSSSVEYCPSQIVPQVKETDKPTSTVEEPPASIKTEESHSDSRINGVSKKSSSSSHKRSHEHKSKRSSEHSSKHSSKHSKSDKKDRHRDEKKHGDDSRRKSSRSSSSDSHSKSHSKRESSTDGKSEKTSHRSSKSKSSKHKSTDDEKKRSDKSTSSRGIKRRFSECEDSLPNGHNSSSASCPTEVIDVNDDSSDSPEPVESTSELQPSSSNNKPGVSDRTSNVFLERWKKAKETVYKSSGQGKIRVSSVTNVSALISAKKSLLSSCSNSTTIAQVPEEEPRATKRVAHKPKDVEEHVPPPKVLLDAKVPYRYRLKGMSLLYNEFAKHSNADVARCRAEEEEAEIAHRASSSMTYTSLVASRILKVRNGNGLPNGERDIQERLCSSSKPDYTFGLTLYECFSNYVATSEELSNFGFPLEIPTKPFCAYTAQHARTHYCPPSSNFFNRICNNCSQPYTVDKQGYPTTENDCHYHYGRMYFRKGIGDRYGCCNGEVHSEPCTDSKYHVSNTFDEDCLKGFTKALPFKGDPIHAGVFAVDCEMSMTTRGSEMTRVTFTDLNNDIIYDKIVKPRHPILDYCTRYSGITAEVMNKPGCVSRHDVHKWIRENIYEQTILVGHGLDNDLKALRLIHKNIVDTAIVFPHKNGLPFKKSLKFLYKDTFGKEIQASDSGHDSAEDARAAMDLMLHKIREDSKIRKPRTIVSLTTRTA